MKFSELLHLVRLNLTQNKFKVILTSIGIIVGAATIVIVIAVGRGGKADIADQFRNLNAGAIDISYEQAQSGRDSFAPSGNSGGMPSFGGGGMPSFGGGGGFSPPSGRNDASSESSGGGRPDFSGGEMPDFSGGGMPDFSGGGMFGGFGEMFGSIFGGSENTVNMEKITLSAEDMDTLATFVPDLSDATISYTTKQDIYGGSIEETESYTVAGTLSDYAELSNLSLLLGDYLTESNEENKEKVCVLGYNVAKSIFGSAEDAYDSLIYIDDRPYVVNGILDEQGTVESGISADDAIFIPYSTGVKYLTGSDISPTITVIAADVNNIDTVISNIETVLAEDYPNAQFTISDAGSKMEAASKSNETLTLMLIAMATIVFIIGGIGIMNVLFVSVKERTKEIGILKAIGSSQKDILLEFIMEACCISLIGGIIGVLASFAVSPIISSFNIRLEMSVTGAVLALVFSVVTGTVFGFYPAWKASRLVPVEALASE